MILYCSKFYCDIYMFLKQSQEMNFLLMSIYQVNTDFF